MRLLEYTDNFPADLYDVESPFTNIRRMLESFVDTIEETRSAILLRDLNRSIETVQFYHLDRLFGDFLEFPRISQEVYKLWQDDIPTFSNLISNPSFETSANWNFYLTERYTKDDAYDEQFIVKLNPNSYVSQNLTLDTNSVYNFSFWVRSYGSTASTGRFGRLSGTTAEYQTFTTEIDQGNNWTRVSGEFLPAVSSYPFSIICDSGLIEIDAVQITKGRSLYPYTSTKYNGIQLDPEFDEITNDQWAETMAKDAEYRERLKAWMKAIHLAGTVEGVRWAYRAAVGRSPASILENYKYQNLIEAKSQIVVAMTNSSTTLTLIDASDFPSSGTVLIENEKISYTGKTNNTLTGVTRGVSSTTAAAHSLGTSVSEVDPTADSRLGIFDYTGATEFTIVPEGQITSEQTDLAYRAIRRISPAQCAFLISSRGVRLSKLTKISVIEASSEHYEIERTALARRRTGEYVTLGSNYNGYESNTASASSEWNPVIRKIGRRDAELQSWSPSQAFYEIDIQSTNSSTFAEYVTHRGRNYSVKYLGPNGEYDPDQPVNDNPINGGVGYWNKPGVPSYLRSHPPTYAIDGDASNYWLSEGYPKNTDSDAWPWLSNHLKGYKNPSQASRDPYLAFLEWHAPLRIMIDTGTSSSSWWKDYKNKETSAPYSPMDAFVTLWYNYPPPSGNWNSTTYVNAGVPGKQFNLAFSEFAIGTAGGTNFSPDDANLGKFDPTTAENYASLGNTMIPAPAHKRGVNRDYPWAFRYSITRGENNLDFAGLNSIPLITSFRITFNRLRQRSVSAKASLGADFHAFIHQVRMYGDWMRFHHPAQTRQPSSEINRFNDAKYGLDDRPGYGALMGSQTYYLRTQTGNAVNKLSLKIHPEQIGSSIKITNARNGEVVYNSTPNWTSDGTCEIGWGTPVRDVTGNGGPTDTDLVTIEMPSRPIPSRPVLIAEMNWQYDYYQELPSPFAAERSVNNLNSEREAWISDLRPNQEPNRREYIEIPLERTRDFNRIGIWMDSPSYEVTLSVWDGATWATTSYLPQATGGNYYLFNLDTIVRAEKIKLEFGNLQYIDVSTLLNRAEFYDTPESWMKGYGVRLREAVIFGQIITETDYDTFVDRDKFNWGAGRMLDGRLDSFWMSGGNPESSMVEWVTFDVGGYKNAQIIAAGDPGESWSSDGNSSVSFDYSTFREGYSSLRVKPSVSNQNTFLVNRNTVGGYNLSNQPTVNRMRFRVFLQNADQYTSMQIRIGNEDLAWTNYFTTTISGPFVEGWNEINTPVMNSWGSNGSPTLTDIRRVGFVLTSSRNTRDEFLFDGLEWYNPNADIIYPWIDTLELYPVWGGCSIRLYSSNDNEHWEHVPIWQDAQLDKFKIGFDPQNTRYYKLEFSNLAPRIISDFSDATKDITAVGRSTNAYPPILLDSFRQRLSDRVDNIVAKVESFSWDDYGTFEQYLSGNFGGRSTASEFSQFIYQYVTASVLAATTAAAANATWERFEGAQSAELELRIQTARQASIDRQQSYRYGYPSSGAAGSTLFWEGIQNHNYETEIRQNKGNTLYFVGLREIQVWRSEFISDSDYMAYREDFFDSSRIDTDNSDSDLKADINGYITVRP